MVQFDFTGEERHILELVRDAAAALNVDAYLIGGHVRDKILGRPSKDMDFLCVGSGIDLAHKVAAMETPSPQVTFFKNFGTAMVRIRDWELEFVGARKESYQRDSRKPIVEEGTLEDDQLRRDFIINTLALDLNKGRFLQLVDRFGGLKDIENKVVRTPTGPDKTFSDDPLRMLRGIRFATQLDFNIEAKTYEAIGTNSHRIKIISQERITDELNKIIMAQRPSTGFKLLFDTGLLKIIFPELVALHGVEVKKGQTHKDNFYHTLQVLDNVAKKSDDLWLRWAAILHDIAKPDTKRFDPQAGWTFHGHEVKGARMTRGIFRRMRLPLNDKMKFVQKMVALHLRPIGLAREKVTDSAIRRLLFEAGDDIDSLMALCEADITSKNKSKVKRYLENFELVRQKLKEVEQKDHLRNWQPPVSGDEIIRTFGIKPSPVVGELKNAIKEAILEGEISNNHEEAFVYMLRKGKELGLKVADKD